jgi:F0F1-type ATP synthase assembly protein I
MTVPENNSPNRKYKWPWFVLAFVIVGFVLAVLWVALAAKKIASQRDDNSPLPASAPAR